MPKVLNPSTLAPMGDDVKLQRGLMEASRALEGRQLTAITFVMDYVQMQFDDLVLSCFNLPIVEVQGKMFSVGHQDWRNELCGRIGRIVDRSAVNDDLVLTFDDASLVRISVRSKDYVGPEAFCLAVPGGPTIVG
jgi:hypothetical protein